MFWQTITIVCPKKNLTGKKLINLYTNLNKPPLSVRSLVSDFNFLYIFRPVFLRISSFMPLYEPKYDVFNILKLCLFNILLNSLFVYKYW